MKLKMKSSLGVLKGKNSLFVQNGWENYNQLLLCKKDGVEQGEVKKFSQKSQRNELPKIRKKQYKLTSIFLPEAVKVSPTKLSR